MSYMQSALDMLDRANAPADIGAHLDTAICRLRDHLSQPDEVQASPKTAAGPQN